MINSFKGPYAFLSNFYIDSRGCVEVLYQALKTSDPFMQIYVLTSDTPAVAKRRGKQVRMRPHWDDIKLLVMKELLRWKFSKSPLLDMLLDTGDEELIEGNYWNDTYWGVCNGEGQNHLGKLLMQVRDELRWSPEAIQTMKEALPVLEGLIHNQDIIKALETDGKQFNYKEIERLMNAAKR